MTNVKGLDKLLNKLNQLGADSDEMMIKAISRPTKRVQRDAKLLCPVGDSGRLRNSIESKITKDDKGNIIGLIFTNVEYAPYVEFGTGPVGAANMPPWAKELGVQYKQNKWLANIPDVGIRYVAGQVAQPFLYPAYKQSEAQIAQDIRDVLNSYIRRLSIK